MIALSPANHDEYLRTDRQANKLSLISAILGLVYRVKYKKTNIKLMVLESDPPPPPPPEILLYNSNFGYVATHIYINT